MLRRRLLGSAVVILLCAACQSAQSGPATEPKCGLASNPAFSRWVIGPDTGTLHPQAVYTLHGGDLEATTLPLKLVAGETIVLDFGMETGGELSLSFSATSALQAQAHFAEAKAYAITDSPLTQLEQLSDAVNPFVWLPKYHQYDHPPPGRYQDPTLVGGFRYVALHVDTGSATLAGSSVAISTYRTTADHLAGYFTSSDDGLNRAWYAGLHTLDLCTIHGNQGSTRAQTVLTDAPWVVVDGAKRDRMVWLGDLFVAAPLEYLTRGTTDAVSASLDALGAAQRSDGRLPGSSPLGSFKQQAYDFVEYNPYYALIAWDQYLRTGNLKQLSSRYPVLERMLQNLTTLAPNDLLDLPPGDGLGWAYSIDRSGEPSFANALYYWALGTAAKIADALGKSSDAAAYRQSAARAAAAFQQTFWDGGRGVYVESASNRVNVPLDANSAAVLAGLAGARTDGILAYLEAHLASAHGLLNVDPAYAKTLYNVPYHNRRANGFIDYLAARAFFQAGDVAEAFSILRQLFVWMAQGDPGDTDWEFIGPDGKPEREFVSLAHAWSAGATVLLTERVLGVRPLSPGYATFIIAPQLGDLAWARGRVPTPHGPIDIELERDGSKLLVDVSVPADTQATLSPEGYLVDGKPQAELAPGEHCLELAPGGGKQ